MSRQYKNPPKYRRHKQSGQAIVTLSDGLGQRRDVLLGKYGTAKSRAEYGRIIAEWEAAGRRLPTSTLADLTVNELLLAYWRFAEGYYRKNGKPTKQLDRIKRSLRPVRELYGHTLAKEFGPLALKAVREQMVRADWTRGFVNCCVGCIKRAFGWGVENELIPPSVYQGLRAVVGLKKGRSEARESQRIRPVADEHVDAALPFLMPPVRAMVEVQRLSGMRPLEVCLMRPRDIDRRHGRSWVYRPESHKTEHHGIHRAVFLGPRAREVLRPFLESRPADAYVFVPREGMAHFRKVQRQERKSKVQPSQVDRKKRRRLRRSPGEHYTPDSYRQSIFRACEAAQVPAWHPNQLRHSRATEIRREAGLDAARAVLGHTSPAMTEHYAELDAGTAAAVMERLG
jgi:integrase